MSTVVTRDRKTGGYGPFVCSMPHTRTPTDSPYTRFGFDLTPGAAPTLPLTQVGSSRVGSQFILIIIFEFINFLKRNIKIFRNSGVKGNILPEN